MTAHEVIKSVGDGVAVSSVIGTILQWLPPIAALFAILWYSIGLYEKITGKPFFVSRLAKIIRREKNVQP